MNAAVGKSYILKYAERLGFDKKIELEAWADEVFNSVETPDSPEVWRHVGMTSMLDTDCFVAGQYVKPLAAQYIHFDAEQQNANLDWLVADLLCFAEVNGTLVHFRKMRGGKQSIPFSLRIVMGLWSLLMWVVWICIVAAGFFLSPWIGAALLGLTAFVQYGKFRAWAARGRLLHEMLGTYQCLESTTFSWSILWEHMAKSRHLGAVWPPELYRLVELRMQQT